MVTLHLFPLPDQINALTAEQIVSAWRASGVLRGIGLMKAGQLKLLAKDTIGLEVTESIRIKMKSIMDEYDFLKHKENEIWKRIRAIVETNADFHKIMSIPHISLKLAAYLLAEVGDFRDFSHPRQLVRLAGFNLMERSSGGSRGQSQITKRGRSLLRRVLYFIVLEQLKNAAPGWHQLHKHYTTRKERPLKKMQSVIALCCKFLRVVWGMIKNNTPYDPDKLIRKSVLSKMA
jgi:transposase